MFFFYKQKSPVFFFFVSIECIKTFIKVNRVGGSDPVIKPESLISSFDIFLPMCVQCVCTYRMYIYIYIPTSDTNIQVVYFVLLAGQWVCLYTNQLSTCTILPYLKPCILSCILILPTTVLAEFVPFTAAAAAYISSSWMLMFTMALAMCNVPSSITVYNVTRIRRE